MGGEVRLTAEERGELVAASHHRDLTGSGCSCDAVTAAVKDIVAARLAAVLDDVCTALDEPIGFSEWMNTNPHAWATACVERVRAALGGAAAGEAGE